MKSCVFLLSFSQPLFLYTANVLYIPSAAKHQAKETLQTSTCGMTGFQKSKMKLCVLTFLC